MTRKLFFFFIFYALTNIHPLVFANHPIHKKYFDIAFPEYLDEMFNDEETIELLRLKRYSDARGQNG